MRRTDEELVRLALHNDKEAADELFKRHRDKIYNFQCRYMKNTHDAEDITIETFMKAYNNLGQYDPDKGNFISWLYAVSVNCARNEFNKRKLRRTSSLDDVSGSDDGLTLADRIATDNERPDHNARAKEMDEALCKAITGLHPVYREVVLLCDIDGMKYEDAAAALKINRHTLATRLRRARAILAKTMKNAGLHM